VFCFAFFWIIKGKPGAKFLRKGAFFAKHFDETSNFVTWVVDTATKKVFQQEEKKKKRREKSGGTDKLKEKRRSWPNSF
jgi:hypothetical protein